MNFIEANVSEKITTSENKIKEKEKDINSNISFEEWYHEYSHFYSFMPSTYIAIYLSIYSLLEGKLVLLSSFWDNLNPTSERFKKPEKKVIACCISFFSKQFSDLKKSLGLNSKKRELYNFIRNRIIHHDSLCNETTHSKEINQLREVSGLKINKYLNSTGSYEIRIEITSNIFIHNFLKESNSLFSQIFDKIIATNTKKEAEQKNES